MDPILLPYSYPCPAGLPVIRVVLLHKRMVFAILSAHNHYCHFGQLEFNFLAHMFVYVYSPLNMVKFVIISPCVTMVKLLQ